MSYHVKGLGAFKKEKALEIAFITVSMSKIEERYWCQVGVRCGPAGSDGAVLAPAGQCEPGLGRLLPRLLHSHREARHGGRPQGPGQDPNL